MNKSLIITLILLLVGIGVYAHLAPSKKILPTPIAEPQPEGNPVFEWNYTDTEICFEGDCIPGNDISITATYPNGTIKTKPVDSIEGGCNEYPEPDKDIYKDSTMIICYYAGLGRYYKVISQGEEYFIQRKVFEEASPDYNPPVQQFGTIERF